MDPFNNKNDIEWPNNEQKSKCRPPDKPRNNYFAVVNLCFLGLDNLGYVGSYSL